MSNIKRNILIFALCFTVAAAFCGFTASTSFAASADGITVIDARSGSDKELKAYSKAELETLASKEGSKVYNYSAFKHTDTYDPVYDAKGPTIAGILQGAGINPASLSDDTIIKVTAADGYPLKVTAKQLFKDKRYYYPNAKNLPNDGTIGGASASDGKAETPAVLNMNDGKESGTFCIAQIAPNEKNKPIFAHYLLGGKITVTGEKAVSATPVTESWLSAEGIVEFKIPDDEEDSMIYYTVDGSNPGTCGNIYNYYNYGGTIKTKGIAFTKAGDYTVKAVTKHYGKTDSEVKQFDYSFKNFWGQGQVKAKLSKYNEVTLSGYAADEATGYRIFYREYGKDWQYKDVEKATCKLSLSAGNKCEFKVIPYTEADGKQAFGLSSTETSVYTLSKVKKASASKKSKTSVKVKWSEVKECTGYEIYKAVNSSKFKKAKTLSSKKLAWTDTKLAKKKTYKYKVRAYKTEGSKKIYSPFSGTKKVKL